MTQETDNAWVKLFSPENALITIPLDLMTTITKEQASNLLGSVRNLIGAGFSVLEHGLEDGELAQEVALVEKRVAGDGTPVLDFFVDHPKLTKKYAHKYMNTEADVAEFENASGMKIAAIPTYEGDIALDKASPKAAKYVVKLPRPIRLVYEISQKWREWKEGGAEGNEPMKKIIKRIEPVNGNGSHPQPAAEQKQSDPPPKDKMTFAKACAVQTPGGREIGSLTRNQLDELANSNARNVTAEMKEAANVVLKNLAPQPGAA